MKGSELKQLIIESGFTISQVADMLNLSQQNMSSILSRDDVKTGTLEKVTNAIGKPVSYSYGKSGSATASGDHNTAVAGNGNSINDGILIDEIAAQRRLTEQALSQNDRLIGIIEDLTNNK